MTTFYMDTSALAKAYMTEVGTAWVKSMIAPITGNVVIVCDLTPIEFVSLLARRQREGILSATDVVTLHTAYLFDHHNEYLPVELTGRVLSLARNLLLRHPLRTLDAIQLAAAIEAMNILGESITFVSGDTRLLTAASGEGFVTDNPLSHP